MTEEFKKSLYHRIFKKIHNDDTDICIAAIALCMLEHTATVEELTAHSWSSEDRIRYGEEACRAQTSEQIQEESSVD